MSFTFDVIKKDENTGARLGKMTTPHGAIDTPAFMPVGTQGTVKAMRPDEIRNCGAQIILGNTYHLYLRPGHETVRDMGGLHTFMNWPGPILTDSGGFQVFSLGALRKILPEGVMFRSHIDGSKHLLTPGKAIEIQQALGSDIMMCLDDCTPYPATHQQTRASMALTLDWANRCRDAKIGPDQALFGIVQGGTYIDLRKQAVEEMVPLGFDGYALGGVSVGEPKELMYAIARDIAPLLPAEKPRYLMGVGLPADIVHGVSCGIDMFDCVIPTRCARHGLLFTNTENIVIKNARWRQDNEPLDATCDCYTCRNFSRGYLRHLYVAGEILAMILNTIHNIRYYMRLMENIRAHLSAGTFGTFQKNISKTQSFSDKEHKKRREDN
ncbi:MAG: tRNA guanosine(34) transglycosylase Tgt [Smithellaceae bacterium]